METMVKQESWALVALEILVPVGALLAPLTKDLAFKNRVTQNCLPSKMATNKGSLKKRYKSKKDSLIK